jgi:hypothetical protein
VLCWIAGAGLFLPAPPPAAAVSATMSALERVFVSVLKHSCAFALLASTLSRMLT